ncbi:MAG: bifunctional 3-(3-hydroxy-phenyl)propionate/3-hydroxycinnamic acid hydroxylase [Alphaproteobacteria bacterium]|nr:bifunctional 3-(3-hydroxy-phenyl)propionate/3-hydroxycinnamic acid hydroxylase [Alphaproteobacteria bacterium]
MYDVTIVGYGPVGAMLAALLGAKGRKVLVVERDTSIYPLPRAVHMDHEVFRLISLVNADEAVMAISRPTASYDFETADGDLLMGFVPPLELAPTGYPWSSIFHQPTLEKAIRADVARHPNVEVRLGVEFVSYDDSGSDGVRVTFSDDPQNPVETKYLVGCDGGRSPVRRQAGIGMDDLDFNEPWVVVDVLLKEGMDVLHKASRQICDPQRPVTSIPIGHGRHRWEFMLLHDEVDQDMTAPEKLESLIAPQLPDGVTMADIEVERSAVYTFHGVFAERWRDGRVLIAGDAAHQMPPFMGQGLCSGVRDAANLAWKLDAILSGHASDALLDTVQPEREPQIRFITETAIAMGQVVCTHDPEIARARDAEMCAGPREDRISGMPGLPPVESGGEETLNAGLPLAKDPGLDAAAVYQPILIVRSKEDAPDDAGASKVPGLHMAWLEGEGALHDPDGLLAEQLADADALLARPDKIIFGTGKANDLLASYVRYLETGNGVAA